MSGDRLAPPLTPEDPHLCARRLELPAAARPALFVVVDTEEEFDWGAPLSRGNTRVRAIRQIGVVQRLLSKYGLKPIYVIDFPVASQPDGYLPIRELVETGLCTVGAHLHPWVNPPFEEALTPHHSYACNLPLNLEAAKLRTLTEEIGSRLGIQARVYKAGRYGFGRSTIGTLERLGFAVDASVCPHMDFSADGGPSFAAFDAAPFLFGRDRRLLEIPCSVGYVGYAGRLAAPLHRAASRPAAALARVPGVLARAGIAERVMLSPEGNTAAEMRRLTSALLGRGIRTFSLTFHSPSVAPGHTPYVRSRADLQEFLFRIESYCDFFFGVLGGVARTPLDFHARVAALDAPEALVAV